MKKPLISVIIPTFNRKQNVINAIDSVLTQTFDDFELIIIDDGSTDGTDVEIDTKYSKVLKYVKTDNLGVSHARNIGVEVSQGEYIAFLDSDDIWHQNKLEKQIKFHLTHPSIHISQTQERWIRKGKRVNPKTIHQKPQGNIFSESLQLCTVTPSSVFIKRDTFKQTTGFDEKMMACEDYDLWIRLAVKHEFGLLDEQLLTKFGGHEDQLSMKYPAMDRFRIYSMAKLLLSDHLKKIQKQSVISVFLKKTEILIKGLHKRDVNIQPYETLFNEILYCKISLPDFHYRTGLLLDNCHFS
ncbi:MAG: glycosyltransferase [Deltaproteobacteria bacterium]|nr:glycosyltransferase [Deltaproteobacteria bacterium]